MTYVMDQGTGLVKEGHVAVGPRSWDMIIGSRSLQRKGRGLADSAYRKNSEVLSHKSINTLSQKVNHETVLSQSCLFLFP